MSFALSCIERKYWRPALVETHNGDIIDCLCDNEGLSYRFKLSDVEPYLEKYPKGNKVWYFNETKDREIAEIMPTDRDQITVNPRFISSNFKSWAI